MIQAFFDGIDKIIANNINSAKSCVYVAIAWFTNQTLFECLFNACCRNVEVKVLILDDILNRNEFGLNFGILATHGAKVRFSTMRKVTMHNKFCIIDNKVITGSYNWTYQANSNNENVVVIDDQKIVYCYCDQFKLLFNAGKSITLPYEHIKWTDIKEGDFSELQRNIYKEIITKNDDNKELKCDKLVSLNQAYKSGKIEDLIKANSLPIAKNFRTILDVLTDHYQDYKCKLWKENIEGKEVINTIGYNRIAKWIFVPYELKEDNSHNEYVEGVLKPNMVRDDYISGGLKMKIYDKEFLNTIKQFIGSNKLSPETRKDIPDLILQIEMAKMFLYKFPSPMYNMKEPSTCPNGMPRLRAGINIFGIVKEIKDEKFLFYPGWNPEERGKIIQGTCFNK